MSFQNFEIRFILFHPSRAKVFCMLKLNFSLYKERLLRVSLFSGRLSCDPRVEQQTKNTFNCILCVNLLFIQKITIKKILLAFGNSVLRDYFLRLRVMITIMLHNLFLFAFNWFHKIWFKIVSFNKYDKNFVVESMENLKM